MFHRLYILSPLLLCILLTQCTKKPTPSSQHTPPTLNHPELIFALCKKLSKDQPLSSEELKQFSNSIKELNYDDTLTASRLIEPAPDASRMTGMITPGEPRNTTPEVWEAPAALIAGRLLELAPVHTIRYAEAAELAPSLLEQIGIRCGRKFMLKFGEEKPKLAWQETLHHYAKYWELVKEDRRNELPAMASGTVAGIWQRDPKTAQRYLLGKTYQQHPYATLLQQHSLHGILITIEHDPDALEQFLSWLEDDGFSLADNLRSHSFRINLSRYSSIDHIALALLARIDPDRAIRWAKEHDNPRIPDWQYAVYAGWYQFWPYQKTDLPRYQTRCEDSITWLAQNAPGKRGETYLHKAFWSWCSDHSEAAYEWLGKPTNHPLEKKRKAYLIKEFINQKN